MLLVTDSMVLGKSYLTSLSFGFLTWKMGVLKAPPKVYSENWRWCPPGLSKLSIMGVHAKCLYTVRDSTAYETPDLKDPGLDLPLSSCEFWKIASSFHGQFLICQVRELDFS